LASNCSRLPSAQTVVSGETTKACGCTIFTTALSITMHSLRVILDKNGVTALAEVAVGCVKSAVAIDDSWAAPDRIATGRIDLVVEGLRQIDVKIRIA
jgi:hypothetical protein